MARDKKFFAKPYLSTITMPITWASSILVAEGNAAISDGTLGQTICSILNDLKPEASYFAEDKGVRTGFIFFNLENTSQIPAVAEPWFLAFHAHVEIHPAMNLEDLKN